MAWWLPGLPRRASGGKVERQQEQQGESTPRSQAGPSISPKDEAGPGMPPTPPPTPPRRGRAGSLRNLLWLVVGLLGAALAVLASFSLRREWDAVYHGHGTPSWLVYRLGLVTMDALEVTRKALMPPYMRAAELTMAFSDGVVLHHLTAVGAFDAFGPGSGVGGAAAAAAGAAAGMGGAGRGGEGPCLRCEEVALAASTAVHVPHLCRLLRGAAVMGALAFHPDREECYTLTRLGEQFQRGNLGREMALWFDGWAMRIFHEGLAKGLRTGEVPFEAAYNTSLWSYLRDVDPRRRANFDAYMIRAAEILGPALAEALDEVVEQLQQPASAAGHAAGDGAAAAARAMVAWPGKYVCDVGGGGGPGRRLSPLLTAILARHPAVKGLVYDLPEAGAAGVGLAAYDDGAEDEEDEIDTVVLPMRGLKGGGTSSADARRRIKTVTGSFLERDEVVAKLGGGKCDVLFMKHILHDWDDKAAVHILRNLREAMLAAPRGHALGHGGGEGPGRLAIFEFVAGGLREQGPGGGNVSRAPYGSPLHERLVAGTDLSMLCLLGQAKERTEAEFRALFATAGFRMVAAGTSKSPMSVMLLEPYP